MIKSGTVRIEQGDRLIDTLSAHNIFGEMALVDSAPRSATAIAESDVQLVPVGEKQFLFLVSRTPHFALNLMRIMARRLRAAGYRASRSRDRGPVTNAAATAIK